MTAEILKDINEIYTRIFHHRHFINGEIDYFLNEFELKRGDREIEHLFNAVQNTIDARETSIEKCRNLSESNLPLLKIKLDETLALCENVLARNENTGAAVTLEKRRADRADAWQRFIDDMKHKQSCVDNTFEEKEEELREFYSDLERKLHIHK